MTVVPLAIAISLLLVATFLGFFLYERRRSSQASAEHDSLLPFEDETPRVVGQAARGARGVSAHPEPSHDGQKNHD